MCRVLSEEGLVGEAAHDYIVRRTWEIGAICNGQFRDNAISRSSARAGRW